jgi:molybdopterin synthase catalytic subunit
VSTYDDAMRPAERSEGVGGRAAPDLAGPEGDTWLGLADSDLPLAEVGEWVIRPDCGGSVVFTGTARNHAEGRTEVTELEYEAYAEQVLPALARVAAQARSRWSDAGRIAILHRVGSLRVTEAAVVVAVSAPHRHEAFDAARFCIDEVKATAPIWKREHWAGGVDWGRG